MSLTPQIPDPLTPRVLAELAAGSDWLVSWWPAAVLAAAAVLLLLAGSLGRRRGGRAHRRWPAVVGAVIALVLASGFAVNTIAGFVPNVAAAQLLLTGQPVAARPGSGQLAPMTIPVPVNLRMPASTTWVYTPPGYDRAGTTRYPVVYLIHGSPGKSSDWVSGGDIAHVMDVLIAEELVRPMIVVAPDVNGTGQGDTECLNSTRGGSQVETYLTAVVVPWVDQNYATLPDWPHRVIGGMSSGGFCALDQGLLHQELFGTIIALEPYGDPGAGGRAMLATAAEFEAHTPTSYLPTLTFAHPVPTFLDVGGAGGGGNDGQTGPLAAQLRARGQIVESRIEPAQGHNWTMARLGIPHGLVFASAQMPP